MVDLSKAGQIFKGYADYDNVGSAFDALQVFVASPSPYNPTIMISTNTLTIIAMSADTFPVNGSDAQVQCWVKELLSSTMPPDYDYNHAMVVSNAGVYAIFVLIMPFPWIIEMLGDELATAFVVLARPRTEFNWGGEQTRQRQDSAIL